jgi:hypothetical protein
MRAPPKCGMPAAKMLEVPIPRIAMLIKICRFTIFPPIAGVNPSSELV